MTDSEKDNLEKFISLQWENAKRTSIAKYTSALLKKENLGMCATFNALSQVDAEIESSKIEVKRIISKIQFLIKAVGFSTGDKTTDRIKGFVNSLKPVKCLDVTITPTGIKVA